MSVIACSACGRNRPHAAHGWCITCYMRRRRQGHPPEARPVIICSACGQSHPHAAHGWCQACYQRWVRHGRPKGGPPAKKPPQPCGTDAGYQRHKKLGEECRLCQRAHNQDQNQRRSKARSQATTRGEWTAEQASAARTVALAAADSPADRRLLLEALGLAPPTPAALAPAV